MIYLPRREMSTISERNLADDWTCHYTTATREACCSVCWADDDDDDEKQ